MMRADLTTQLRSEAALNRCARTGPPRHVPGANAEVARDLHQSTTFAPSLSDEDGVIPSSSFASAALRRQCKREAQDCIQEQADMLLRYNSRRPRVAQEDDMHASGKATLSPKRRRFSSPRCTPSEGHVAKVVLVSDAPT